MNFDIKHDPKNSKFFLVIAGKECSLKYEMLGEQLLDLKLLYVPKNLRGQGLAGIIIDHVVAYAKKNSMKIKPTCSYVSAYLTDKKEYSDIVHSRSALTI